MSSHPLWEQHACLPLTLDAGIDDLARYARPGGAYVSINVGFAPHSTADVLALIDHFRSLIAEDDRFTLVDGVTDIDAARLAGRTAIAFDLEDSAPLAGDLDLVQRFYDLGVRSLLPTYNFANRAGSGCLDAVDEGLTGYGRDLVAQMNEVGMFVDGSHCSARTGLDMASVSTQPTIYSHSCLRAVWEHERNITDEQAVACAQTGGVIGIAGVGIFLGPNTPTLEAMVEHIDHAVSLVGPEHVGVGSDYSFDLVDFNREMQASPHLFPDAYTRWGPIQWIPPETLAGLGPALTARGYPDDAVAAILGGNFRRLAGRVWSSDGGTFAE